MPLTLAGAGSARKDELAVVAVHEALVDERGCVREVVVATLLWKLPAGADGARLVAAVSAQLSAACGPVGAAVTGARKRPVASVGAEDVGALLRPPGVRLCLRTGAFRRLPSSAGGCAGQPALLGTSWPGSGASGVVAGGGTCIARTPPVGAGGSEKRAALAQTDNKFAGGGARAPAAAEQ